ncbi:MAG: 2-hydroxyacid dehydrogenase [Dehalococcoidia bacterium]
MKPRVFVTRDIGREALEALGQETELELWPDEAPPSRERLREKAAVVDGLLTTVDDWVDAGLFQSAPHLKVVSQMATGVDNIDLAAATRRGIPVGYTPGILAKTTADLAFALLLAAARRIQEAGRWVRQGNWRVPFHPLSFLGRDVHGATLGIIGLGKIGLEVARRAQGFDMEVLYASRHRRRDEERRYGLRFVELPTLLRTADFVSLHVPLTPETHHLLGEAELRMMKSTALLVNTSRGPVVDQKALYRALQEGWIAGAALDVTEKEPIPPDDPLLSLQNLVITPHIGSASVETRRRMALLAVENLLAGLQGRRLTQCANLEVYHSSEPTSS